MYLVRVEVYSAQPARDIVVPVRTLVRKADWARRLVVRFNRLQDRKRQQDRALAYVTSL